MTFETTKKIIHHNSVSFLAADAL